MDISIVLKEHSEIPLEQLRVVRQFDDVDLSSLRLAIIFIFAAWSGPAILAFERFTRILAKMDVKAIDLIVLDTDCLNPESTVALWGRPVGGAGETIWIRDGHITARLSSFVADNEPELIRHTEELLQG